MATDEKGIKFGVYLTSTAKRKAVLEAATTDPRLAATAENAVTWSSPDWARPLMVITQSTSRLRCRLVFSRSRLVTAPGVAAPGPCHQPCRPA